MAQNAIDNEKREISYFLSSLPFMAVDPEHKLRKRGDNGGRTSAKELGAYKPKLGWLIS